MTDRSLSRRHILKGAAGLSAAAALGGVATTLGAGSAAAVTDGHGLRVVGGGQGDPRLWWFRFRTSAIGWDPAVNVLLPDGYHTSSQRYPVLYLLHGGGLDQDFISFDRAGIRGLTAGRQVIVVMPDGGRAGWYSNPVHSNVGPRNWETFHMSQLVPWIDANFRTHAHVHGRAVAGFSMGGFGALKYAAKYYGHFASVSSHSGPASLRRDGGLVAHWANLSSATVELGGGSIYGMPFWNEARVSADNAVQNVERYRGKRVFLVAGTSPEPVDVIGQVTEGQVLAGHREFRELLAGAGIAHEAHEAGGGHVFRHDMFTRDLDGMLAHLTPAG